jgi:choloylglycine hydrolase
MKTTKAVLVAAILAGSLFVERGAQACTSFRLIAKDGTVVFGRTMEFAIDVHSDVIMVPRGYARTGTTPDGENGMAWTAKYACVGANGEGLPEIFDGGNEKGLALGVLYFPTMAGYMKYDAATAAKTIAPWQVGTWILENCATVEEVKQNIDKIVVADVVFKAWGFTPPLHYVVHDASGKCIVIEYVDCKLHVHDNPLGVMTNAPTFDWQMTNLRNYVGFSLVNRPPVVVGGVTLAPFGQGTGMLGMPGDFTPPSRFVRAVAFSTSAFTPKTGDDAVLEAFHLLNSFDIPKRAARKNTGMSMATSWPTTRFGRPSAT